MKIDPGSGFHVFPGSVSKVVLAANTIIEGFECLLYPDGLSPIGIVEHHANRSKSGVTNCLNSSVFFGDVVAIRGSVTPFDFQGIGVHLAVNLKRPGALTSCIRDTETTGRRKLMAETRFGGILKK